LVQTRPLVGADALRGDPVGGLVNPDEDVESAQSQQVKPDPRAHVFTTEQLTELARVVTKKL
jgi:hypothetical protein